MRELRQVPNVRATPKRVIVWDNGRAMNPTPLPCDVLPCLSGDIIIVPHAMLTIRLTPDQQHALAAQMPALRASPVAS